MNLFTEYEEKIIVFLRKLEKKELIKLPKKFSNITVELPPKNHEADLSCNAALVLSKVNQIKPLQLAEIIKTNLILNFKEIKKIEIAGPGFLNITFKIFFWGKYLNNIIKLNNKYGINKNYKKKIQY